MGHNKEWLKVFFMSYGKSLFYFEIKLERDSKVFIKKNYLKKMALLLTTGPLYNAQQQNQHLIIFFFLGLFFLDHSIFVDRYSHGLARFPDLEFISHPS